MDRIVVGVDGSDVARRALQWAIDEARLHGARVEAVYAWTYPYVGAMPVTPVVVDLERVESNARELLDTALSEVDPSGVTVEPVLAHAGAAQALVDRAKDADLLVVGSRGRGGFAGLLLGSVSQQVTHHAPCPVVVVPHEN